MQGRSLTRWRRRAYRWWRAARPTLWRIYSHGTGLVAAGCAFYATLALFPAISMLLSIYGLVFNPHSVESQLGVLTGVVPPEALKLISLAVHGLVQHHPGRLTLSLIISAAITLWSAATGTKSMISALNIAYGETERRGLVRFQLTGLALTLAAILGAALALALLVALPAALSFFGTRGFTAARIHDASFVIMMLFVAGSVAMLYRFGPSRRPGRRLRILPGTVLATLLWLIASVLFTVYVGRIASFDATYGPLAAVAGVMLWFWVSAFAVLAGAELNSALEQLPGSEPVSPLLERG